MIAFHESRSARESWMGWLILAGGLFSLVSGGAAILPQVNQALAAGKLVEYVVFPIALVVTVAVFCLYLFIAMRLEVTIKDEGISWCFLPFIRHRHYSWDEINHAWIRKYCAIAEYGGWGYRGVGRKRRAYTMGEKYGIQLLTTDGRDILLGTLRPEAAVKALKLAGKGEPPQKNANSGGY